MGILSPSDWVNAMSSDPTGSKQSAEDQMIFNNLALGEQQRQFDTTQANFRPFLNAGTNAVNQLSSSTAPGGLYYNPQFTMQDYQQSPAYQAMVQTQGLQNQGMSAQAAASGMLGSGNFANALQSNAQSNAAGAEGNAFNQWMNQLGQGYQMQAGMANLGIGSANNLGGFGANMANNAGNLLSNTGQALGNANVANRLYSNQAAANLSNNAGQGIGNWLASYYGGMGGGAASIYGSGAGAATSSLTADDLSASLF